MRNNSMSRNAQRNYQNYYTQSNLAYEIAPAYYPKRKEEESQRVREERKRKAEEKKALRIERFVHRLKLLGTLVFVFSGCILLMLSSATVVAERIALTNVKNELNELKNENNSLRAEVSQMMDLDYIGNEAENRLGMSEPQNYQLVYINVPKESYTVSYSEEYITAEAESASIFTKVAALFKKG